MSDAFRRFLADARAESVARKSLSPSGENPQEHPIMSDSEREAQIRERCNKNPTAGLDEDRFLLRLLDQARKQIAAPYPALAEENRCLRAEIVRLTETMSGHGHWCAPRTARLTSPPHKHDFDLAKEAAQTVSLNWKEHARYAITDQDLLGMIEQATLNAISRSKMTTPPGASAREVAFVIRDEMHEACGVYHTGATGKIIHAIEQAEARGFKTAIEKTQPGWEEISAALRMIGDAVAELAPVGGFRVHDVGPPAYIRDAEEIIAGIHAIQEQAELAAHNAAIEAATQIAQRYRSEAILERYKMFDEERKACWLWALDTSNGIERAIRALRKPPGS